MDITYLRYFKVVAEEEHMTRAANKINITQPALSVIIHHLESELGFPLFDRKGRQIFLNEYGKIFLKHINTLLQEYDTSLEEMQHLHRYSQQQVHIGITGTQFTAKIITKLLNLCPEIHITQLLLKNHEVIPALENNTVDFVLSSLPCPNDNIETVSLFRESLFLAVPTSHPLAEKKAIHLIDAKDESFLVRQKEYTFHQLTESICRTAGFEPKIAFESHPDYLLELVKLGKGVYLVAESYSQFATSSGICFLPVVDEFAFREVYLLFKKERIFNSAQELIKNRILNL